jgi:uncharacterized protein with NRDE domain
MCLLALFFRMVSDAAVVVGANREELYARGGEPPRLLEGPVLAVAGVDPMAGGSWLGVNAYGVLVAVTNRPKSDPPAQPRSRGLLVRELLNSPNAAVALSLAVSELGRNPYAGCNLLVADGSRAEVIHAGDWLRIRPLPPGLHVLTSHDVNDASDCRLGHALWWLGQRNYDNAQQCLDALKELCAQPGNGGPPMCLHGDKGGTVSSSLIALRSSLAQSSYVHAQGSPDRTPYDDYSHLLHALKPT